MKVSDIEGIGPVYAKKLKSAGARTIESLLKKGATPAGRKELEDKIGVSQSQILEWVNRADLFRIKGVGNEYSDLLEAAGVDTVGELAKRNVANLYEKIVEVNKEENLVRRLPAFVQVEGWVRGAKKLSPVIQYSSGPSGPGRPRPGG